MRPLTSLALWLVLAGMPASVWALDYRSVSADKTLFYDAPSAQAKKLFVAPRDYPVEIIVNLGEWIKVRDVRGELAWVESARVSPRRTVLVRVPQAEVRESADATAKVVFRAEQDVVLEWVEPAAVGWVKVRHRDGLTGFIQSPQVWGL